MLKIRKCFEECGVSQAELARFIGCSPPLISRVFKTGELPAERAAFLAALGEFASSSVALTGWMLRNRVDCVEGLLVEASEASDGSVGSDRSAEEPGRSEDLDTQEELDAVRGYIVQVAGEAAIAEDTVILCLARLTAFLLDVVRDSPMGMDEMGEFTVEVTRLLRCS